MNNGHVLYVNSEWIIFPVLPQWIAERLVQCRRNLLERLLFTSFTLIFWDTWLYFLSKSSSKQLLFLPAFLQNRKLIKNVVNNNFHTITKAHFGKHACEKKKKLDLLNLVSRKLKKKFQLYLFFKISDKFAWVDVFLLLFAWSSEKISRKQFTLLTASRFQTTFTNE